MRAAVYVRLSEADERSTFARQQQECAAQAAARGWAHDPDHDVYSDYGISAWRKGVVRPAFEELLGRLDRYDVLISWKLDRLVRSHRDLARLLDQLDAAGVALVLVTEGLDASTPMGRTMLEIATSFANLEATTTGLRVRSAQTHMAQAGRHRGSPVPYGWTPGPHPDGAGTWLHLEPSEATVVREMVGRLLAGESARKIAHDLNGRQVPTRKGGRWTSATILGIVRSPRMVGWQPYSAQHRSGQVARDNDGQPIPAADAMVDEVTWRRVRDAVTSGRRATSRSDGSWLNGIALCGLCGARMHANGTSRHAIYICSARRTAGDTVHATPVSMRRVRLERIVSAAIVSRAAGQLEQAAARLPVDDGGLLSERDRLQARIDGLDDDWLAGRLDDRRHARLTASLASELDAVEGRMVARDAASVVGQVPEGFSAGVWEGWSTSERRRLAAAMLESVEVGPFRSAGWRLRLWWRDGEVVEA